VRPLVASRTWQFLPTAIKQIGDLGGG